MAAEHPLHHNEQDLSIAKGVQTQASPFHLSRGVIRSITLVFWVGHLFQPFVIVWCVDYLFGRGTGPNQSFRHWHRNLLKIVFTVTGLPDAFQPTPCVGFVEVRHRGPLDLVRAPLVFVRYRACFLLEGEKVLGDFPGLCKILHETTLLGCPSCIPVFSYFCRYRFVLAVLHVDDGSYWSTMVSDDSSRWVCRDLIVHCWAAG